MKNENRIRKNTDNYLEYWWLRSAYDRSNSYVAYVYGYGDVSDNYYYSEYGVAPSFII